ncbi:MAG: carboxylating nicotinate-nucleotide diphosphorylase [Pseudomonadales bacterium]|nr:carboxylating nicotinate-nucleotide diphosphorylase [Pseudomonadales bacterium]
MFQHPLDPASITRQVQAALAEDVGAGDLNAALIDPAQRLRAQVITREAGIFCGRPWVNEIFAYLDPAVTLTWAVSDGDPIAAEQTLLTLEGPARAILTGERCALNFMQTLSATATVTRQWSTPLKDTGLMLLDTRKTLPGLRTAQKYAVLCGGGANHRMGLFDAFLIKENHIAAAGSISEAIAAARRTGPGKPVEIEVETLEELDEALAAGADIVMLDEFDEPSLKAALARPRGDTKIEVSGNVDPARLQGLAALGVDYVSLGALTKHVRALDLSLRAERA